eukprot:c20701_g1_i1 orf=182-934(+)
MAALRSSFPDYSSAFLPSPAPFSALSFSRPVSLSFPFTSSSGVPLFSFPSPHAARQAALGFIPGIRPSAVVNDGVFASTAVGNSLAEELPIEKRFPSFPTVLDINQIRDILPHRFPFLLVDRVVEYSPGVSAVGIKNVTINDNFFPGHFPQRPIMPGVLMVEAMAQVGGIVMLQPEVGGSRENFFFAGVDKVRFRKPVIAGDTLVMRMNLVKLQRRFGIAKMEGKAYVGGELVCEGEFMMSLGGDSGVKV